VAFFFKQGRSRDGPGIHTPGQVRQNIFRAAGIEGHLLQGGHIRLDILQYSGDALRGLKAVAADTAVDVVSSDSQDHLTRFLHVI
jgi:hypothetical protein